jgi:hypothetical protein
MRQKPDGGSHGMVTHPMWLGMNSTRTAGWSTNANSEAPTTIGAVANHADMTATSTATVMGNLRFTPMRDKQFLGVYGIEAWRKAHGWQYPDRQWFKVDDTNLAQLKGIKNRWEQYENNHGSNWTLKKWAYAWWKKYKITP